MIKTVYLIFFTLIIVTLNKAQDVRIGASENKLNATGAFYDYSDPRYINIMVNIWGYVKFPGKYYVPEHSRLYDLISYAGGPIPDAYLDDIRMVRSNEKIDSVQVFNISDLMDKNNSKKVSISLNPSLKAGDIIVLPGEPKLYFRDYVTLALSITSTLISLAILVLNIVK